MCRAVEGFGGAVVGGAYWGIAVAIVVCSAENKNDIGIGIHFGCALTEIKVMPWIGRRGSLFCITGSAYTVVADYRSRILRKKVGKAFFGARSARAFGDAITQHVYFLIL
jgi:hypothetical protein